MNEHDPEETNTRHQRKRFKAKLPFYYLIRNICPNNSPYPTTQQLVYCAETLEKVERYLEQVKFKVTMPKGCSYSIDYF